MCPGDPSVIVSGGDDAKIIVWKLRASTGGFVVNFDYTLDKLCVLEGHHGSVRCVALPPLASDASMLLSAGTDNLVYRWQVKDNVGTMVRITIGGPLSYFPLVACLQ